MANYHPLCANLPASNTPLAISNRSDPWLPSHRVPFVSSSRPLSPDSPTTITAAQVPQRKATAQTRPGCWFLLGRRIDHRWTHRNVDALVSTKRRSLAMGGLLASRRQEEVDTSSSTGILGHFGEYQRSGMESPTRSFPPLSP